MSANKSSLNLTHAKDQDKAKDDAKKKAEDAANAKKKAAELAKKKADDLVKQKIRMKQDSLMNAIYLDDHATIKKLVAEGASVNYVDPINLYNYTPLQTAVCTGKAAVVNTLLSLKADPNLQPNQLSSLHIAASYNGMSKNAGPQIIKALVSKGAHLNANNHYYGDSPLLSAVRASMLAEVKTLIELKADVNLLTHSGHSALHLAQSKDCPELTKELALRSQSIDIKDLHQGMTPLQKAVAQKATQNCKTLISMKADLRTIDHNGNTLLHTAAANDYCDLLPLLLAKGLEINVQNQFRQTPFFVAVANKQTKAFSHLLALKADVKQATMMGKNALHIACEVGFTDIITELGSQCSINAADDNGATPLHQSVMSRQLNACKILLNMKANVNALDIGQHSPLSCASQLGYNEFIPLLISKGAKMSEGASYSCAPLHNAVTRGNIEACRSLLALKADIKAVDQQGNTVLHKVRDDLAFQMIPELIAMGAEVDALNNAHETPLQGALINENIRTIKSLLSFNANVNVQDRDGMTALHWAAIEGTLEILPDIMANAKGVDYDLKYCLELLHTHNIAPTRTRFSVELQLRLMKVKLKEGATLFYLDPDLMRLLSILAEHQFIQPFQPFLDQHDLKDYLLASQENLRYVVGHLARQASGFYFSVYREDLQAVLQNLKGFCFEKYKEFAQYKENDKDYFEGFEIFLNEQIVRNIEAQIMTHLRPRKKEELLQPYMDLYVFEDEKGKKVLPGLLPHGVAGIVCSYKLQKSGILDLISDSNLYSASAARIKQNELCLERMRYFISCMLGMEESSKVKAEVQMPKATAPVKAANAPAKVVAAPAKSAAKKPSLTPEQALAEAQKAWEGAQHGAIEVALKNNNSPLLMLYGDMRQREQQLKNPKVVPPVNKVASKVAAKKA